MSLIIAVDSDVGFLERFKRILDRLGLLNDYDYLPVEARGVDEHEVIAHCAQKIATATVGRPIEAIFVDIVIIERDEPPQDRSGFAIAHHLRLLLPTVPIITVTRFIKQLRLLAEASFHPDVDGLIPKPLIEGEFSRADFFGFLNGAKAKRSRPQAHGALPEASTDVNTATVGERLKPMGSSRQFGSTSSPNPETPFQLQEEPRCLAQIHEVGVDNIALLLEALFPAGHGTVSYLRPGFSGSYLFRVAAKSTPARVSASLPRLWAVKISDNRDKLAEEAQRTVKLFERVPKNLYPSLLRRELAEVGKWSALAFELQEDALTLWEYLAARANVKTTRHLLHASLVPFLKHHYGDPIKRQCFLWPTYYQLDNKLRALVLSFLEQCPRGFSHMTNVKKRGLERLRAFIVSNGKSEAAVSEFAANVETCYIHGDLNSRNILVSKDRQSLVFIDFANSAQNHALSDIAKLETDLIFLVMDSRALRDTRWERVDVWQSILQCYAPGMIFGSKGLQEACDPEIQNVAALIALLRSSLVELGLETDERQYRIALLHYTLKALSYSDVTVQKKAFGLGYVARLLETLAEAP